MEKTAKGKHSSGDTAWEEATLKKYRESEMRLIDIEKHLCKDTDRHEFHCTTLYGEIEEDIYNWFTKLQDTEQDLHKWLCIDRQEVCCPPNHYGKCLYGQWSSRIAWNAIISIRQIHFSYGIFFCQVKIACHAQIAITTVLVKGMERARGMGSVPVRPAMKVKDVRNVPFSITSRIEMKRNSCAVRAMLLAIQMLVAREPDREVCDAFYCCPCETLYAIFVISIARLPGLSIGLDNAAGRWRMHRHR